MFVELARNCVVQANHIAELTAPVGTNTIKVIYVTGKEQVFTYETTESRDKLYYRAKNKIMKRRVYKNEEDNDD